MFHLFYYKNYSYKIKFYKNNSYKSKNPVFPLML